LLRKTLSWMMLALLLTIFNVVFNFQVIGAATATIIVPDDYPTIQEAINAASFGDTVYVRSGTYYEHLTVNKSISLVGENPTSTIIDGSWVGTVVYVIASHVTVANFTIIHSGEEWLDSGIRLNGINNCTIKNNLIVENRDGVRVEVSSYVNIYNNTIERYTWIEEYTDGAYFDLSNNNLFQNNKIEGVHFAVRLRGSSNNTFQYNNCSDFYLIGSQNNRILNNYITYDIYLESSSNNTIIEGNYLTEYGHIIVDFSSHNTFIRSNKITAMSSNYDAISIYSSNNTITQNIITHNSGDGIYIRGSRNTVSYNYIEDNGGAGVNIADSEYDSVIFCNNITDNKYGIITNVEGSRVLVFHNNFVDNTIQIRGYLHADAFIDGGYPTGGNYWNTYADIDVYSGPYQNETGSDGIWDHSYRGGTSRCIDRYPLTDPWTGIYRRVIIETIVHQISINETTFYVTTESNMTVTCLDFNITQKKLTVNASGHIGSTDFINITIPKQMLKAEPANWIINITDASSIQTHIKENSTHASIYLTFEVNKPLHQIEIYGTQAIPEFHISLIMLLLFASITLISTILLKKRGKTKPQLP